MAVRNSGQIVLFKFPQTDFSEGKILPALLLSKIPGDYDDWLLCMISTREKPYSKEYDEIMDFQSNDFKKSGLKSESVIRIFRIAVVDEKMLLGKTGEISNERLMRIKKKISGWLLK
jgi:mRNA interferase MazF